MSLYLAQTVRSLIIFLAAFCLGLSAVQCKWNTAIYCVTWLYVLKRPIFLALYTNNKDAELQDMTSVELFLLLKLDIYPLFKSSYNMFNVFVTFEQTAQI